MAHHVYDLFRQVCLPFVLLGVQLVELLGVQLFLVVAVLREQGLPFSLLRVHRLTSCLLRVQSRCVTQAEGAVHQ